MAPFLGWRDVPLGDLIAETTGIEPVISNDVSALMAAEGWFGVGQGLRSFAIITLGVGVGYGLVMHDRLVTHPDMGIGLVGHYPLQAGGGLCLAGHRRCATAALTTGSLVAAAANLAMPDRIVITGEGVDLARIADQALDEGIRADRDARAGALDVGQMSTAPTDADCTSLTYFASTPRV